jgi:hypothetical protein
MLDSIKRKLKKRAPADSWSANLTFEPVSASAAELPAARTAFPAAGYEAHPASNDVNMRDYYKGLARTAILHGGRYQEFEIPVPWLIMTLSGLEMKPMPAEMMWKYEQQDLAGTPEFDELFASGQGPVSSRIFEINRGPNRTQIGQSGQAIPRRETHLGYTSYWG